MSGNGLNDTIGSPGNSEVALPDGLLAKMAGNDWNERNQAITELEAFITSHATELGSNIVKVHVTTNVKHVHVHVTTPTILNFVQSIKLLIHFYVYFTMF